MMTRRARRWITRGLTIAVLSSVLGFFVMTWFQAGTVDGRWLAVSADSSEGEAEVRSVGVGEVELVQEESADRPGVWGLVFDGGRAIVGDVVGSDGDRVRRVLESSTGALTPGTQVAFDRAVWGLDQAEALGFTERLVTGEAGILPTWSAPGTDDTWVVLVHGNGADPSESFRLAQAVVAAGYPAVVATYRHDAIDDGTVRHGFGRPEWRDLDAITDDALRQGARDFVLVGYGSGASIVGTYLYESRHADRVAGVVLDAPLLSLGGVIAADWRAHHVPGWVIEWSKALASVRFGLDLGAVDHVARAAEWVPPTLILHGRADDEYPLEASEAFALAKGDGAVLLTFPGAGPGASWNTARERYEAAATDFVDRVAAGPSEFEAATG